MALPKVIWIASEIGIESSHFILKSNTLSVTQWLPFKLFKVVCSGRPEAGLRPVSQVSGSPPTRHAMAILKGL